MPKVIANNIEIEYETFGNSSDKPLLLVNGLGSQMISWDEDFIKTFLDHNFFVICFDNRDVGLSAKFEEAGTPNIIEKMRAIQAGEQVEAPYSLEDMADDAIGLLDALNIEKAHICGVSMGGMIVQVIAMRHPSRVLSLTTIMSSTGNPDLPQATPEAMQILLTPAPTERNANIEHYLKVRRILNGSVYSFDEIKHRKLAERLFDRCFYPPGLARQLLAIMTNGNRKPKLSVINVPTLVIHGTDDPLVPFEGGKDTHEAINGSEFLTIEGMGHSLPPETLEKIIDAISKNATKA